MVTEPDLRVRTERAGAFDREEALARLGREHFDVLVIGGGITGAGVALDAASRGLRVALVDKGDFASGTSSKSSKMVHGGIRYLTQRELRLVYENLAERQRLLDNAPHLVSPLPFLIPLFGHDGVVAKTVARSYSSALLLYDATGGLRIGNHHRRVDREVALEHLPLLRTDRLVAGFLYFDARADDARLALTVVRTAVLDFGAVAANYAPVTGFLTDVGGRVVGARVEPVGATEALEVRASVVVNAGGVWADEVRALDEGHDPRSLRPAKGVHVTVPLDRLPCDIAAVLPVPKDRRSIFVVPWPEAGFVYLGTTDTSYAGPLDDPLCTGDDVDYLLGTANAATTAGLTRADVTGVWAGLRPLLAPQDPAEQLSERTADLSRRHAVFSAPSGLVTVTGGKLTTYRKMAEDTVDEVARQLRGRAIGRCVTKRLALRGAPKTGGQPWTADHRGLAPAALAHLRARYGTEAGEVLRSAEGRPELLTPLVDGLPYLGVEFVHAVRREMARSLDDLLARRTRAVLLDARASAAAAGAVARLVTPELGWDEATAAAEVARFTAFTRHTLEAAGLDDLDALRASA
ncbi:MAG TPA: glycerol-3-phosphate dehydrogenase/oxidase [Acidimicrobiales bacterium]|nr:glycerol-3-phosphate dehydrogenase/oxidase [Acidimicrobiales bacterium]